MENSRVLGDYTLSKQIGQGALGGVYLAEHRFMKKQFALKVFPEDLCRDRGFIQRFEEEVSQLSVLEHPHIVKLHNISYDQGVYFLVTDCIVDQFGETTNLNQYLQSADTVMAEDQVFNLLNQIADALDYAHHLRGNGKGPAHRGIKLNNILVSEGAKGKSFYLSDFGLSRIIGTGTFLTRTFKSVAESLGIDKNLVAGTFEAEIVAPMHLSFLQSFHFLAPEQKNLSSGWEIDYKADVYAFGVLAYYLLMNEFPEGCFDMPSRRQQHLKYPWDNLIRSCLQKLPEKRPEHLLTTVKALEKINLDPAVSLPQNMPGEAQIAMNLQEGGLRPVLHVAQLERPKVDPDPAAALQVDHSVKHYTPEKNEEKIVEPLLTEMVVIKGGSFVRGSTEGNRDEMPQHEITIDSFAIDIHPVTNEQFVRFLEAMGGVKDKNHNDLVRLKDSRINSSKGRFSIESGYIKHPVVGVTWYGAAAYAKWIGKRLPTEAEWEVAAYGGLDSAFYPSGDEIEKSQANFFSFDTTVVMSYPANGYHLYDMVGNVYEWCQDWYGYNYYETSIQEPLNPQGPLQGVYRVLRGGCWKSLKEDLRCAKRHRNNPGTVNSTYGFRCAADVE